MRDADGNMIKNAHLTGTIRRILKLLHYKILPVFVFDGDTPLLKLKTVQSRRAHRDKQVAHLYAIPNATICFCSNCSTTIQQNRSTPEEL